VLGRGVAECACAGAGYRSLEAGDRTRDHDRPPLALPLQHGQPGLDGVPGADQVDVDLIAECRSRIRLVVLADQDTGVGDDRVEPAELLDTGGHRVLEGIEVAHVRLAGKHPAPGRGD